MIKKINILLNYDSICKPRDIFFFKELLKLFAIKCGNIEA
jgi:hypothetical protein